VKTRLISIAAIAALASSVSAFAVNSDQTAKDLSVRTNALENQVHLLKAQIDQMQTKNKKQKVSKNKNTEKPQASDDTISKEDKVDILLAQAEHRPFIVSSPVFGVRRPDDSFSSLMNKLPSINEDLVLLKLRQKMDNYAKENGIPYATRPIISISGALEGQVGFASNDKYSTTSKSEIALSKAEVDIIAEAGSWTTGAMTIEYDDDKADYTGNVAKWNNSRLRIGRAFITLGKLNKIPFYFTIGQVFAPFGSFGSNMITTPATRTLGRVKDRMVVFGYGGNDGLYAQIFGLDGETKPNGGEFIRHTGADIGHRFESENFAMNIGAGILGNLAESKGMQDKIFGKSSLPGKDRHVSNPEKINSRVFGLNGYCKATFFKKYSLMAEYIGASNNFDRADLAFNGQGAKPQAYSIEGSMAFKTFSKPSSVYAAFGGSSQALALGVAKQSYAVGYAMSPTKYALTSIEYRHDVNYAQGDRSVGGSGVTIATVPGRHNNRVTVELGLYF